MGGAKNCPETPRQRMIGMMYLVLTAMLALNVSTDILNGFRIVDDSLQNTFKVNNERVDEMYQKFQRAYQDNSQKYEFSYKQAKFVKEQADIAISVLDSVKREIAIRSDAKIEDIENGVHLKDVNGKDNREAATIVFGISEEDKYGVVGKRVFYILHDYRDSLIAIGTRVDSLNGVNNRQKYYDQFHTLIDISSFDKTEDPNNTWQFATFYDQPSGAALAVLSKLQNDIRNAELQMMQNLYEGSDVQDIRINKMEALVIPESNNVVQGGKYKAKIILAGVDSTKLPKYYLDGRELPNGSIELPSGQLGSHQHRGELMLFAGEDTTRYPFNFEYSVNPAAVNVSNTELSVVYRNYENKMHISVPGVAADKIRVNVTGASIKGQGAGKYILKPNDNANEIGIKVQGEISGNWTNFPEQKFRVKNLPKPDSYISIGDRKIETDVVSKNILRDSKMTINVGYGPDDLLELGYTVTMFDIKMPGHMNSNMSGNKLPASEINYINRLNVGDVVVIYPTRAVTAQGAEIKKGLRPIAITVK